MKHRRAKIISRRELLKGTLGLTITAGCFSTLGIRQALAQAGPTGKPLLTEREINARIPHPRDRQAYWNAIEFAKRDLLGYLNANFYLTPAQVAQVRSIPREDLMRLNAFLDRAKANNQRITVRLMPAGVMPRSLPTDGASGRCGEMFFRALVGDDAGAGDVSN